MSQFNGIITKQYLKDNSASLIDKDFKVVLTSQNIFTIESRAFEEQDQMQKLYLDHNKIINIELDTFDTLINLNKLVISFNLIEELPNNVFANLSNLQELEITNNPIKKLGSGSFNGLKKLKRLILSYNQIESIDPLSFADLINLELLVIGYNKLESLHSDTFKELGKLKRLNLRNNYLTSLCDVALFRNLVNVQQIILSRNNIDKLGSKVFQNMFKIQRIFFHSNKMTKIESDTFHGLSTLKLLDLANNQISIIPPNSFDDLLDLEYIDLSKNQLTELNAHLFSNLTKLIQINLSKNSLTSLDSKTFKYASNLRIMNLDFNKISFINQEAFNYSSLQEIYCNTLLITEMKQIQEKIIEANKENFLESIKCICNLNDEKKLLQSPDACHKLENLSLFSNRYKQELYQSLDNVTEEKLIKLLVTNLKYLLKDLAFHISKYKTYMFDAPEFYTLKFLESFALIIRNWSKFSTKFCKALASLSAIKVIFKYLNHEILIKELFRNRDNESKYTFTILVNIYGSFISTVYNISNKESIELKKQLNAFNAIENAIKISGTFVSFSSDFCLKLYMIIANLLTDKNISQLTNLKEVVKELSSYVGICADKLNNLDEDNIERCPLVISEQSSDKSNQNHITQVIIVELNDTYFYLTDFLNVLYNFAVSDEIKHDVYETFSMRSHLKTIILNGNETEKEYALKLLWQLAFDVQIAKSIGHDAELSSYIYQLNNESENSDDESKKKINKNTKGIVWLLNDLNSVKVWEKRIDNASPNNEQHIMISYNSKSRDLCLKIKKRLEEVGHKVWIDVESIYGSSLESMADAIENSKCVLVCVTEKYKESNFCRLEAEYLIQKRKQFIPLLMQKGYRADGWLGIVLGSRIFIDFCKNEFDIVMNELLRNLNLMFKSEASETKITTDSENSAKSASEKLENILKPYSNKEEKSDECRAKEIDWNESQVEIWLTTGNINQTIIQNLIPCNGQVLYQLFEMLVYNPEFFYGSLKTNTDATLKDLKELAYFCSELKKLFKKT